VLVIVLLLSCAELLSITATRVIRTDDVEKFPGKAIPSEGRSCVGLPPGLPSTVRKPAAPVRPAVDSLHCRIGKLPF
jgi:hypothetical protein